MNVFLQTAVIGVVALAAAGGTWAIRGNPVRATICDPATLKPDEICLSMIPEGEPIVWVDARARKDWEKNGISGSALWNLDPAEDMQAFEAEVAARVSAVPRVVVYCGDEQCGISRQVAQRIRALDLGAEVYVLRGGWRALHEAGKVKDSSPKP
jgi:rhodanese-related sulfurtransferase